jgi:membrane-associated phospholipid phosphatase
MDIDKRLPFVAPMMLVYVFVAYSTWAIGFFVIGRESRSVCYEVMAAEQIAKLMCMVCFILLPSTIERPEITGSGFCQWLSRLIYSLDTPDNLFPSIHCLENWICFRGAMKCKKAGKGYKIIMFIAAIMVFASTLLVKQHVLVDVIGGIVVVEAGLFLSKKLKISRIYYALERKLENYER